MTSRPPHRRAAHVPGQLEINWNAATSSETTIRPTADKDAVKAVGPAPAPTLRLKWDFRTSFPEPTEQAIEAGIITAEDCTPENVRSLHDEHAREMLAVLHDLDAVLDARRRGVDPRSNKRPVRPEAGERLQRFFETEPPRLTQWFENLLAVYAEAFGDEAAEAFDKAVRAWHAGVEVLAERRPAPATTIAAMPEERPAPVEIVRQRPRTVARLPVPRPLPPAVAAGNFGFEEEGKPVNPRAGEVRAITEQHVERLIELLNGLREVEAWLASAQCSDHARLYRERDILNAKVRSGVTAYAEDFGQRAAEQLEAYVRRQAGLDAGVRRVR